MRYGKRSCDKCHQDLTQTEIYWNQSQGVDGDGSMWLCEDCIFDMDNQDTSMDYEQHSDADPGL